MHATLCCHANIEEKLTKRFNLNGMEWNETISRNTHNTEMAVCVSVCVLDLEEIFRRLQVKKHPTQRHTHTHLNLQRH